MKPLIMDIDVNSGEVINREMTDQEYSVYLQDQEVTNEAEII